KTGWQGIGIHGTHDPDSIGTLVTEGCIRLLNENVLWLRERVAVGTKVLIEP
ncbi:MAG: L,D-transpeptidase, partial [Synergistales bacterium]|nr:L,D-transpeptidase [Synergistales bacterium]